MHAEIISIGDEILNGQILDTNAQWLSLRHAELGVRVLYFSAVRDDLEAIAGVFRQAIQRADVIVSTGGLGPTADDLTREGIAKATGRELVRDQQALQSIRDLFARRKRPMPPRNELQADLPAGSRVIPNPNGTAPGIALEIARPGKTGTGTSPDAAGADDWRKSSEPVPVFPRADRGPCHIFALPGVPAEMREMWYGTVAAAILQAGGGQTIRKTRNIKCFGAGESQIESMIPDLISRRRYPLVGINASDATIILRITAEGATEEECDAAMEPTAATIYKTLGKLVFGEGNEELQHAVVRLLRQKNRTLATVEWGTGGLVADWLGNVDEGQGFYLGGIVVRDEAALKRAVNVPADLAPGHGAAGGEVASRMAVRCRERFGTDLGLAVGPFPRFDPAAAEPKPMFVALATADGVEVESFPFALHPALLRTYTAKRALNVMRLSLSGE